MPTSFNVNQADLTFILQQIKIAEATSLAETANPVSILQAIMDATGASAANAAQLPFGLRTVDGSYNSLLNEGTSQFGAADTLFPRLTDPVFLNDPDGDGIDFDGPGPGPTIVQGNYGVVDIDPGPGVTLGVRTVVDADPRIISNLIVDMSTGNPAAIEAALAYIGITGSAAVAAREAITAAHNAVSDAPAAAAAAQAAEDAALANLATETSQQAAAAAAAANAANALAAANAAVAQDVLELAAATAASNAADADLAAAQLADDNAQAALDAAQAAYDAAFAAAGANAGALGAATTALNDATTAHAAAAAAVAAALATAQAMQALEDAAAADLATAQGTQTAALAAVTAAQTALDNANSGVTAAQAVLATATADSDAADAALATAQGDEVAAQTALDAAQTAFNAAVLANQPTADALAAATTDLTNATNSHDAAVNAVNVATAAAASAQVLEDAAAADLATAQGIQAAALAADTAADLALAAYDTALAQDVEIGADAALIATTALVGSLGAAGDAIDAADLLAASDALAAATAASAAATAAHIALQTPGVAQADLDAAATAATSAALLVTQLTALQSALLVDTTLDATELDEANTALATATASAALATASTDGMVNTGRPAAQASATAAQTALDNANSGVTAAQAVLATATADSDAADAALATAQGDEVAAQTALDAAQTTFNAAVLANQPTADALAAATTDLTNATNSHDAAVTAVNVATAAAASAQVLEDDATADLATAQGVQTAAQGALTAAQAALDGANGDVATAAAALATATANSDAADAVLAAAEGDEALAQTALDVAQADYDTVLAAGGPLAAALASATTALGDATTEHDLTHAALTAAITSASEMQLLEDAAIADLAASQAAQTTAAGANTAAQNALTTANAELLAAQTAATAATAASDAADAAIGGAPAALDALLESYGLEHDATGNLVIPNQSPDIGLSPAFNSWMTFFGQFFDHGLDLVTKGSNGTVYVPLMPDDPLYVPGSPTNFMALTRATVTMVDGVPQHENTTTSWVDQNQTYTSHASHQAFLREYVRDDGQTLSTGKLLSGSAAGNNVAGGIGNWGEVKAQALSLLGINLSDFDVHNVPLLLTDQYGQLILGPNGYAQIVMLPDEDHATYWYKEGNPDGSVTTEGAEVTNHAFLNDIAHHASPGRYDSNGDGRVTAADDFQVADLDPGTGDDGLSFTYDDEMLESHFITGDGRGNENIALTAVHSIFHSEHDRMVDANKVTILETGDLAFINEWLRVDIASLDEIATQEQREVLMGDLAAWDGERLFQAARFTTEMQYQHMVFEEFARRIQPMVDPFIFNNSPEVDPSIVAEFAHTVYRFGHSMLTGTVDRLENDLSTVNGDLDQATLLAVFLNPQAYLESGDDLATINANLIRGLSRDVGSEIDEMIVSDVRSNLLGLPLDLAVLNLARGRDTGVPSLNDARAQLYNDTGLADLKPYTSWVDFAEHIKNPLSIVNFIAAYGTHPTITAATTVAAKRAAAEELVFGVDGDDADSVVAGGFGDRLDFVNATGAWAGGNLGGLNTVDLWIGGLAEAKNEFGGMLGSTFNYVFEAQMENLQNGDRMYYLSRTQGTNLLMNLEPNTFSDIVMRNTDLGDDYSTHLSGALFITPDHVIELDQAIAQEDYNGAAAGLDPTWGDDEPHSVFATKVTRDYTTAVNGVAPTIGLDGHNIGGTIRFLGGEHVVLGGTEGNDRLLSDIGDDTLWGDGGDDYLNGATGADDVFGGEGDDIIEDPFGDDVLRGNQGNDVITSARGFDLLFGDEGNDFIAMGQDAAEAFAGEGDDFVLGGAGSDMIHGNEGDDWLEGGAGFDTLAGENSELFFNSPIIGHDVMFGQGDEVDYDAESGDDIMGSGASVFRYEGMFGFDWAIGKGDTGAVDWDANIKIFTNAPDDILRDRFDLVEGFSGAQFDDKIRGDSRGSLTLPADPGANFADHLLTQEGIDRIDGMNEWLGNARQTLFGDNTAAYRDGNLLLGGDGNDLLEGRGGFDILDGDAYLNVRIVIVHNDVVYSAESLNTDTTAMGPHAGKVFNTNPDGSPNFSSPAFGGRSLQSLLLDGTINPGEMSILREILTDNTNVSGPGMNVDTAVFQGNRAEYEIEGQGTTLGIRDVDGDGFISVRDLNNGAAARPAVFTDDTDLIKNIEVLQFSDQSIVIGGGNNSASGLVEINDPTPFGGQVTPFVGQVLTASFAGITDLDGVALDLNGRPISNLAIEWQASEAGDTGPWIKVGTGSSYTVTDADTGFSLRAVASFTDALGYREQLASVGTALAQPAFSVNENSFHGTVIVAEVPFSHADEDVTGAEVVPATLFHQIDPANNAGGRFTIVPNGVNAEGNPRYALIVDQGGPAALDYEAVQGPADNQYQIVINTYLTPTDPANGIAPIASRQFTVLLNDVSPELVYVAPVLDLNDSTVTTTTGNISDNFTTANPAWIEANDGANTLSTGQIRIDGANSNQLRVLTGDGASVDRTFNLAGVTTATLSFSVDQNGLDAGETVTVLFDAAGDGNFESIVSTITSTSSSAGAVTTVNLTGPFTANSVVRFVSSAINGAGEDVRIDNLNIATTTNTVAPGTPGINHTTPNFIENGAAMAISGPVGITSMALNISSATIVLTDWQAGDVLSIAGALPAGIVAAPITNVAGVMTLTLSGFASAAAYETAIAQVRYRNTSDTPGDNQRTITATVTDEVGTSATATSTITVVAVNDAPNAVNDAVITNSSTAFFVPEWALLANDTDVDGPLALDITAVSAPNSLTGLSLATNPGAVTMTDSGAAGGSFTYTARDGAATLATDNAVVTVTNQGFTNVADNFNTSSFNNSTGAAPWSTSWAESNDGTNTVNTGQIQIDNGGTSNNVLRLSDVGDGAAITRSVNLAGATSATISYDVNENGFDAGETVTVEFSDDGTFSAGHVQVVQTITSTTNGTGVTNLALTGTFTANAAVRFTVNGGNSSANDIVQIDNLSISYALNNGNITGTAAGEILVGNDQGSNFNGGAGNDIIFAQGGDDTIVQVSTQGRDIIDGGLGSDTYQLNGDGSAETFNIYTRTAWLGINPGSVLAAGTEIVVTRNGTNSASIIAELDNVEEIGINALAVTTNDGNGVLETVGAGDTVNVFGNFNAPETSLSFSTITVNGSSANDTVNITGLSSEHRIVFNGGGGSDNVVGTLRPQDVVTTDLMVTPTVLPASSQPPVPTAAPQGATGVGLSDWFNENWSASGFALPSGFGRFVQDAMRNFDGLGMMGSRFNGSVETLATLMADNHKSGGVQTPVMDVLSNKFAADDYYSDRFDDASMHSHGRWHIDDGDFFMR